MEYSILNQQKKLCFFTVGLLVLIDENYAGKQRFPGTNKLIEV